MGNSPREAATKNGDPKSPVSTIGADIPKPSESEVKAETATVDPLAPPPRPSVSNGDYFSQSHGLAHESNPFEFSFAGGASSNGEGLQTPGGTKLPSINAMTSPAILSAITPNYWPGGLRSGPLSPAMLSAPQKDDYFGDHHHLRGGFTPNESGLRSGLTPGGGGSMFPQPSPGAGFAAQLENGVATPGTLEFQRTAMRMQQTNAPRMQQQNITSQPQDLGKSLDVKPVQPGARFDQHDENNAANGLFLLANASGNNPQPTNHYTMAPSMPVHAHPQGMPQSSETPTHMANRNGGSMSTNSGRAASEMSDDEDRKPAARGKGKTAPQNGRRKAIEQPAKAPPNKKAKGSNGRGMSEPPSEDEQQDPNADQFHANGKKMTDEEKRKNFLERNRVAALKCRQRKKQWLQNLQSKVEIYSAENENLQLAINQLREENTSLKTLLMAHRDCPVTIQQGLGNGGMEQAVTGMQQYHPQMANPYGMAGTSPQQQHQQSQQSIQQGVPHQQAPNGQQNGQMDRRFS